MEANLLYLISYIFIHGALALDFRYSTNSFDNGTCIHVELDAVITLSSKDQGHIQTISLNGSTVSAGLCRQDKAELHLDLKNDDKLIMNFQISVDTVTVYYRLNHKQANKHNNILDSSTLSLSKADQAYRCLAHDHILLQDSHGNIASLFIWNATIQAFGMKNGEYSDKVEKCKLDNPSSTIPVKPTSQEEDVSSAVTKFVLKNDKNVACLRLDGNLQIIYQYHQKDKKMNVKSIDIPSSARVTGYCKSKDSAMVLHFKTGSASRAVVFYFTHKDMKTFFDNIEVIFQLDSTTFPNVVKANSIERSYGSINQQLASSDSYWGCQHEKQFVGSNFILKTRHLKIQSSDKDIPASYSKARIGCAEDEPKSPTKHKFILKDGDINCIMVSGAMQLQIPYKSRDNKTVIQTVNVPRPSLLTATGSCKLNTPQTLELKFLKTWILRFNFKSTTQSDPKSKIVGYNVSSVDLKYTTSPLVFYNAENTDKTYDVSGYTYNTPLKATGGGSYECNHNVVISLDNDVKLSSDNLQFEAFRTTNSTDFSGDVTTCGSTAARNKSQTALIVIMCVAGALMIVVIIVVLLVTKKKRKSSYEKMN